MTSNPAIQKRVQSLLDEMLDLIDEYDQASKVDAVLSIKKEIRLRIKKIQREIEEAAQQQPSKVFSNAQ